MATATSTYNFSNMTAQLEHLSRNQEKTLPSSEKVPSGVPDSMRAKIAKTQSINHTALLDLAIAIGHLNTGETKKAIGIFNHILATKLINNDTKIKTQLALQEALKISNKTPASLSAEQQALSSLQLGDAYYIKAAQAKEVSTKQLNASQALTTYLEGLKHATENETCAKLRLALGKARHLMGNTQAAVEDFKAGLALAAITPDLKAKLHIFSGVLHNVSGNQENAIKQFEEGLSNEQADPNQKIDLINHLGSIYIVRKDFKKAIQTLQKGTALSSAPSLSKTLLVQHIYLLGQALYLDHQYKAAFEAYSRIFTQIPQPQQSKFTESYQAAAIAYYHEEVFSSTAPENPSSANQKAIFAHQLAQIQISKKLFKEAITTCQKGLSFEGKSEDVTASLYILYGVSLKSDQQIPETIKVLLEASELKNLQEDTKAWIDFHLAEAYRKNQQNEEAMSTCENGLALEKASDRVKAMLHTDLGTLYQLKAENYLEANKLSEAIDTFPFAIDHFYLAVQLTNSSPEIKSSLFKQAVTTEIKYHQLEASQPGTTDEQKADSAKFLGHAFQRLGQTPEAIAAYKNGLSLEGASTTTKVSLIELLATSLIKMRNHELAIRNLREGITLEGISASSKLSLFLKLAEVYKAQNNSSAYLVTLKEGSQHMEGAAPDLQFALSFNLGISLYNNGQFTDALKHLDASFSLYKKNERMIVPAAVHQLFYLLADTNYKLENLTAAKEFVSQGIVLKPSHEISANLYLIWALALKKQKHFSDARDAIRIALELSEVSQQTRLRLCDVEDEILPILRKDYSLKKNQET